jgi:serine/threonine protein kinase
MWVGGPDNRSRADRGSHYFALPSSTMLNDFQIESVLGHGGFGITYRAIDRLLQEVVAIKEYFPNELAGRVSTAAVRAKSAADQHDFEVGLDSFLEEARLITRFRHPNIMHVRRFFEMHETGYIVLDYERGQTLGKRLEHGPLPEDELRATLFGLLDGLEAIHTRAILHRDLKPSNVILREDGSPVLIDFGAARDFKERHSRSITAIAASRGRGPSMRSAPSRTAA